MFSDLDTPLSLYGVETLDAARALVLSGDMPAGQVPSASSAPTCPLGPKSTASTPPMPSDLASIDPASTDDRRDARSALQAYYDDVAARRFEEAWDRVSPQTQAMWGGFDGFKGGPSTKDVDLGVATNDHETLCLWMTMGPTDFGDADLSRAWLIEVTHGPIANNSADEWIVAPLPDDSWSLWQVR